MRYDAKVFLESLFPQTERIGLIETNSSRIISDDDRVEDWQELFQRRVAIKEVSEDDAEAFVDLTNIKALENILRMMKYPFN